MTNKGKVITWDDLPDWTGDAPAAPGPAPDLRGTVQGRTAAVRDAMTHLRDDLKRGAALPDVLQRLITTLAPIATDGETWQTSCMESLDKYKDKMQQLSLLTATERAADELAQIRYNEAQKVRRALEKLEKFGGDLRNAAMKAGIDLSAAIDGSADESAGE